MLVTLWMTRDPVTVSPETSVADAAAIMARRSVRRLPVVGPGDPPPLLGIVSARDVARAFPPDVNPFSSDGPSRGPRRPVSEIMTASPQTVRPETPIEDAARVLREKKIGALPVTRDGRLVGIITESDIFRAFIEMVGAWEPGVRVTFDLSNDEDAVGKVFDLGRRHGLRVASVLSMLHDGKRMGVVRLAGIGGQGFVDAFRKSGHRVLSVIHDGGPGQRPA
jgi:acetoin utilization protein AcuB